MTTKNSPLDPQATSDVEALQTMSKAMTSYDVERRNDNSINIDVHFKLLDNKEAHRFINWLRGQIS